MLKLPYEASASSAVWSTGSRLEKAIVPPRLLVACDPTAPAPCVTRVEPMLSVMIARLMCSPLRLP
jgi:hypothetical protein